MSVLPSFGPRIYIQDLFWATWSHNASLGKAEVSLSVALWECLIPFFTAVLMFCKQGLKIAAHDLLWHTKSRHRKAQTFPATTTNHRSPKDPHPSVVPVIKPCSDIKTRLSQIPQSWKTNLNGANTGLNAN